MTTIDSISMSSVLGPTFSNFYMSNLENNIFNDIKNIFVHVLLMISLFQQIILKIFF